MAELLTKAFNPEDRLAAFRAGLQHTGGLVSFTGIMRDEGGAAQRLFLDHFPGFTEQEIDARERLAHKRFDLEASLVVHRVGEIAPLEPIVLVATAAAHRREAFEAADYLMDYLKSAAPFWKKEVGPEGARWIEPTARDMSDRQRWEA